MISLYFGWDDIERRRRTLFIEKLPLSFFMAPYCQPIVFMTLISSHASTNSLTQNDHNFNNCVHQFLPPNLTFSYLETNFNYVSTPFFLPCHSHAAYVSIRSYEDLLHTNLSVLIGLVITSTMFSLVCIFSISTLPSSTTF